MTNTEGKVRFGILSTAHINRLVIPGAHASDTIELTHTARDRRGFASGALLAARWIQKREGWFSMLDVLRDNPRHA